MRTINFYFEKFKYGGIERVFLNLLKNLDKSKYKIRVFVLNKYQVEEIIEEISKEIEVIILNGEKKSNNKLLKMIYLVKNYFAIRQKIYRSDLNINFYDSISTLLLVSLFKNRISWIHTNPDKLINKKIYRYLYKKMNKVIFICEEQKEVFLKEKTLAKIRTIVIHNILDYNKINKLLLQEDIKIIQDYLISIARIDYKQKDYLTLLRAYKKLLEEEITSLDLLILGDGPDRVKLELEIKKMKLEKKVIVLGNKPNPYIYLNKATALILSTYGEGLPTVILEAQYCGIPVIASNVKTGIKELLFEPNCGNIFEIGNSEDLFFKIKDILENSTKRNKYIQIGREKVQKFFPEKIIKKIENELF